MSAGPAGSQDLGRVGCSDPGRKSGTREMTATPQGAQDPAYSLVKLGRIPKGVRPNHF